MMCLFEHGSLGLPKYGSAEPICWYHAPCLVVLLGWSLPLPHRGGQQVCLMRDYRIKRLRNLRVVKTKPIEIITKK